MGHNPQSSPTAMPAPLQGAYRKLEFQYIIIFSLKGEVEASFASRRKGCDISIAMHITPFRLTSFGTFPYGAGKKVKLKLTQTQKEPSERAALQYSSY